MLNKTLTLAAGTLILGLATAYPVLHDAGPFIDPNGRSAPDAGPFIDPNGRSAPDAGPFIDPNG